MTKAVLEERVFWGLRVSQGESVTVMAASLAAGREAWCWRSN